VLTRPKVFWLLLYTSVPPISAPFAEIGGSAMKFRSIPFQNTHPGSSPGTQPCPGPFGAHSPRPPGQSFFTPDPSPPAPFCPHISRLCLRSYVSRTHRTPLSCLPTPARILPAFPPCGAARNAASCRALSLPKHTDLPTTHCRSFPPAHAQSSLGTNYAGRATTIRCP
jgi:hypothetical protein